MSDLVLIVDDSEEMVDMLALLFARAGVSSLTAHSLAEVRDLANKLPGVTLAILDVNLGAGEPSGVDVDDWLSAQGLTPRIVYLTGHPKDQRLAQQTADHAILIKPVASKVLLGLVGQA